MMDAAETPLDVEIGAGLSNTGEFTPSEAADSTVAVGFEGIEGFCA